MSQSVCKAKDPSTCRYHGKKKTALTNQNVDEYITAREEEAKKPQSNIALADFQRNNYHYVSSIHIDYESDIDDERHEQCMEEGICRCQVIFAEKVVSASSEAVQLFFKNWNALTDAEKQDVLEIAEKHGLGDPNNFEVLVENGYYGQEIAGVRFNNHEALKQDITSYVLEKGNYNDPDGILDYVRNKGTETAGLSPLEALKKQLAAENNGRVHPLLRRKTQVKKTRVKLNRIVIPNENHYKKAEARPVVGVNRISGVLVDDGDGRLVLIDGYHRLKDLNEADKKYGNFLIVS